MTRPPIWLLAPTYRPFTIAEMIRRLELWRVRHAVS
jgi:hypothetical protein